MTERIELEDIYQARNRLHPTLEPTPLTFSPVFSELAGHAVYFKWENKHRTGSFKERGALNTIKSLLDSAKPLTVSAASAGNHALALSFHAARLDVPSVIVMPRHAPLVKIKAVENTGARVELVGDTLGEAIEYARQMSEEHSYEFISPYDHPLVIAGQGTCGLEILEDLPDVDSVIVPVGGGGLLAGIATAIRDKAPKAFILGVQSDWVDKLHHRSAAKNPRLPEMTIADGIAIKGIGSLARPIIDRQVNKLCSVSDSEIAQAIIRFLEVERTVVEGAGAAGLAALIRRELPRRAKKTVVVVTGSNIDMNLLARLIERDMREFHRLISILISGPDRPGLLHRASGIISEAGANVLSVHHERFSSETPGHTNITFLVEVRDEPHGAFTAEQLQKDGFRVQVS